MILIYIEKGRQLINIKLFFEPSYRIIFLYIVGVDLFILCPPYLNARHVHCFYNIYTALHPHFYIIQYNKAIKQN